MYASLLVVADPSVRRGPGGRGLDGPHPIFDRYGHAGCAYSARARVRVCTFVCVATQLVAFLPSKKNTSYDNLRLTMKRIVRVYPATVGATV